MNGREFDTEEILRRAAAGDAVARQLLLEQHRQRLLRMVAIRLDARVQARIDASDVVQEALLDAAGRLSEYLRERPIPFYPWLRRLAWEHLVKLHEKHLRARKRSAEREIPLPEQSANALAARFAATGTSPSGQAIRRESRERVRLALQTLAADDREVLVLRYLEQLTTAETAAVLGVSEGAVKMRHRRALERLGNILADQPGDDR